MANKMPTLYVLLDGEDTERGPILTDNRDMVRWDRYRAQQKWPSAKDAPLLWLTFMAFSALTRTGQDVPARYADFEDACVSVQTSDAKEEAAEPDPTQ